jgi:hypothetical protein
MLNWLFIAIAIGVAVAVGVVVALGRARTGRCAEKETLEE